MTDGRSVWYPEDVRWMAWERTVVLAREFGPAAISVMAALKAEAKVQNSGWRVKWGYHALDMAAFVGDVEQVRMIVARAAGIGLLDDFEEGEWTFVCRVSGMAASEQKARDAARKAASRAPGHDRTDPDRPGHDRTDRDLQERTGENNYVGSEDRLSLGEAVEEPQATVAPGKQTQRSRKADPDALPPGFDPSLEPAARLILARLTALHAERGGNAPTLRAAGLLAMRRPDADHHAALADLEMWATAGNGARRRIKDWAAQARPFIDGAPKAGADEPRPSRRGRVLDDWAATNFDAIRQGGHAA